MKKKLVICFILLTSLLSGLTAQEFPLIPDKQGTFKILYRTDYVGDDCGYTKAEITAHLQRITDLVTVVRQNPVLRDLKGFEGRAKINNLDCKEVSGYGIPAGVSFEFASWFRNQDGAPAVTLIEPPVWHICINQAKPGWGSSYSHDTKRGYFTAPLNKITVEPGIDVYDGEWFIIYDPSRPPYWITVTVNEAFAAVRESMSKWEDDYGTRLQKEFVEKEYAEIPESERDNPAFFGGGISRVTHKPNTDGQDNLHIVKVNPDYWNRTLPRSAIQILNFNSVQNKEYLRKLMEEYLEKESTSYNLKRFEVSFDMDEIRRLLPLIGN